MWEVVIITMAKMKSHRKFLIEYTTILVDIFNAYSLSKKKEERKMLQCSHYTIPAINPIFFVERE